MSNSPKLSCRHTCLRMVASVLAIGSTSIKGNIGGKLLQVYNIIYLACFFRCGVLMITERKWLCEGFNILAMLSLYGQAGLMGIFTISTILTMTYWQEQFYGFYGELDQISSSLQEELQQPHNLYRPLNVYLIGFLIFFPMVAISDLFNKEQFVSPAFWTCTHLPGVTSIIYANYTNALLNFCSSAFDSINNHYSLFTCSRWTTWDKICLSFQDGVCQKLTQAKRAKLKSNLQRIFATYNLVCALAKEVNRVCGISLFFLIQFGGTVILGQLYCACMYFVLDLQKRQSEWRIFYSQCYWAVVYFAEIVVLARSAERLTRNAHRIGILLHKIQILGGFGEEWVNTYSLQLLHEKISISAASVYILDNGFILRVLAAIAFLLVTAVQYDEGYLLTNPRSELLRVGKEVNGSNRVLDYQQCV